MSGWARARPVAHWLDFPDTTYGVVGSTEFKIWDAALEDLKKRLLNVEDYGAVADAAILLDAVISNGSKVLTCASNPFTAADVGKLIYIRDAAGVGTPLKTTIASCQSAGQVTLTAAATHNSQVDGGPNPSAVYGTPNAAAFNAAFMDAQALASPVSASISRWVARNGVFAQGSYLIESALTPLTVPGIQLIGAGMLSTFLYFCEDAAMVSLGAYNATPTTAYDGTASRFKASGLTICNPMAMNTAYEGFREGVAIQDNGSGDVFLDNITITGFEYGFNGAYGSDFTRFGSNAYFALCDVGAYFGPGSQQLYFFGCDFYRCREGAVFEGAPHFEFIGGSFEDPLIAAVTIEAQTAGTTRSGVPYNLSGAAYSGSRSLRGTWFESNAGVSGRLAPRMLWINGDAPGGATVQGLTARDCYLVSGGTQDAAAHNSFAEWNTTVNIGDATPLIDNLFIRGNYINHVLNNSGAGVTARAHIYNTTLPAGVTYAHGTSGSSIYVTSGDHVGEFSFQAQFAGGRPVTITQFAGQTADLVRVRSDGSSAFISGIVNNGAFVGATQTTTLSVNGAVTIDASGANTAIVTLAANATSSSITNPTTGQFLTIAWTQDGSGSRTYAWPANCKFAGGSAPSASSTAGYTDAVTFFYDGTNWREDSRSLAVR